MDRLNPSVKLIGLIVVTFVLAYIHNPLLNIIIFFIASILCLLSIFQQRASFKKFFYPMIPIAIIAIGMFFTGWRFTSAPSTVINNNAMHLSDPVSSGLIPGKVWNGLMFSSRVLVYASIAFLFSLTTDSVRMIRSFEKQLHMPQVFAYGLLAAWGILPHMTMEYKKTKLAFEARGIHVTPFSIGLLTTLMVKTTRWSEELSMAMESKGFSADKKRVPINQKE